MLKLVDEGLVKRSLVYLVGGPVLTALISIYAFKIRMPLYQMLLLGLIASVSGFWTDWRQWRAGFKVFKRLGASWISGAFGGLIMATVPYYLGMSVSGFAYSMIFAGAATAFICCLLSAGWKEFGLRPKSR